MAIDTDDGQMGEGGCSRRNFMQLIGIGVGVVGATLLAPPLERPLLAHVPDTDTVMAADQPVMIRLNVNGSLRTAAVEPRWSLLYVLREIFGLTGSKIGCDRGECGACTVLLDGVPHYSCLTLAVEAQDRAITTVEGLLDGEQLGPVQAAFVEEDAFQCGYCTPGQIMAVEGLLRRNPSPSAAEIRRGCAGNLCRCAAYQNIFAAADKAARRKKA